LEGRIEGADSFGLLRRGVGVGIVGEEEIARGSGAHGVAEEPDLVIEVGQRAPKEGKDSAAGAAVTAVEQRVLRQLVEVAVEGQDALDAVAESRLCMVVPFGQQRVADVEQEDPDVLDIASRRVRKKALGQLDLALGIATADGDQVDAAGAALVGDPRCRGLKRGGVAEGGQVVWRITRRQSVGSALIVQVGGGLLQGAPRAVEAVDQLGDELAWLVVRR